MKSNCSGFTALDGLHLPFKYCFRAPYKKVIGYAFLGVRFFFNHQHTYMIIVELIKIPQSFTMIIHYFLEQSRFWPRAINLLHDIVATANLHLFNSIVNNVSVYPTLKIIPIQFKKAATQPPTPPTLKSMSDENFINRILAFECRLTVFFNLLNPRGAPCKPGSACIPHNLPLPPPSMMVQCICTCWVQPLHIIFISKQYFLVSLLTLPLHLHFFTHSFFFPRHSTWPNRLFSSSPVSL